RVQTASAAEPETRLMSGVCLSPAYLETARLTSRSSAEARQGKRSDFPNSPSGISGNPFRAHAVPDPTGQRYHYRRSAFVLQILHDGPERTGPDCRSLRLLNREIEDYPPPMTALARDHRRPWLFEPPPALSDGFPIPPESVQRL